DNMTISGDPDTATCTHGPKHHLELLLSPGPKGLLAQNPV
ncbi:unnamed protein product, partial [marine sediment metagenome]